MAAVLFMLLLFGRKSGPSSSDARAPDSFVYISSAKELVKAKLRDPSSAEFSEVEFHPQSGSHSAIVCGKVNARNGFGGMTGAERFIVGGTTALESENEPASFAQAWQRFC